MSFTSRTAMRAATLTARTTLSTTYRKQIPRVLSLQTTRGVAAKGRGEKDDLGGPGGQEPLDTTARDKQNAALRNKTVAAMVLVGAPLFYVMRKPKQAAKS